MTTEIPDRQAYDTAIERLLEITADEEKLAIIRSMRANQHRHEDAWSRARTGIAAKYAQKRNLNVVLGKVSGQSVAEPESFDDEEEKELSKYDHKLRFAMHNMYIGQQKELASLGVPHLENRVYNKRLHALIDEILDGA